jgi:hypothetical protein
MIDVDRQISTELSIVHRRGRGPAQLEVARRDQPARAVQWRSEDEFPSPSNLISETNAFRSASASVSKTR